MNILLYGPEYRPNLSNMIRTAEFYGLKIIFIYDTNGLLDPPTNKVTRADMNHMARVWTAGAVEHIEIEKIDDLKDFVEAYTGRIVATVVQPSATHINNFHFEPNDMIVMGPEKEGLPEDFLRICDKSVYIKGNGHTECLNVSVSLGIVVHEMRRQLEASVE